MIEDPRSQTSTRATLNPFILVVDDNHDLVETLVEVITHFGYLAEGRTRFHPRDLEESEARIPDLFLIDVMLEGVDGRDLARELRARALTRQVPILMMSAHTGMEHSALEAGADDFIPKPFELDDLFNRLNNLIDNSTR